MALRRGDRIQEMLVARLERKIAELERSKELLIEEMSSSVMERDARIYVLEQTLAETKERMFKLQSDLQKQRIEALRSKSRKKKNR